MVAQGVQLCKAGGSCCRSSGENPATGRCWHSCMLYDGSLAEQRFRQGNGDVDASNSVSPIHTHKSIT